MIETKVLAGAVLPSRQSHNIMQTGPSIHRPPSDRDPLDAAAWCQWAVRKFVVAVLLHPSTLLIAASSALIHWAVDLDTMSKSSRNIVPEVQTKAIHGANGLPQLHHHFPHSP